MMKLIISLAAFIAISNGASLDCSINTKLSDTCGSLTVSGVNNADIDGQYNRIDDSLFQKIDGSANYLSYWQGEGGVYVGVEEGDRRCKPSSGSYRVIFDASILDDLVVGDAETFKPDFPSSRTVTISCDTKSTERATPAPVTPVEGVGSICLSTSWNGLLSSPIRIEFSLLAGQYIEIPGGLNGKPAYELVNSGDGCSASVTLMYVTEYSRYMFVRNRNNAANSYYFACETDPISAGTCIGNLQEYMTITQGSDCVCGRTTPTPTTPAPIPVIPIGTDSVCYAVTEAAKNEGRRVQGAPAQGYIELSTLAGQYKLIDESDENGKPVYELTGCGTSAYIKYVSAYGLFMVVKDVNDGRNTYITWCDNTSDITDNDILKCEWTRNEYYTITNSLPSCSCGQTVP